MTTKIVERSVRRRAKSKTEPDNPTPECEGQDPTDLAEWIRLPAPGGRCPRTGLSRGSLNDLVFADPPNVRSVVLKKPGAKRGVRLIHWPSLRAYLEGLMNSQMEEPGRE